MDLTEDTILSDIDPESPIFARAAHQTNSVSSRLNKGKTEKKNVPRTPMNSLALDFARYEQQMNGEAIDEEGSDYEEYEEEYVETEHDASDGESNQHLEDDAQPVTQILNLPPVQRQQQTQPAAIHTLLPLQGCCKTSSQTACPRSLSVSHQQLKGALTGKPPAGFSHRNSMAKLAYSQPGNGHHVHFEKGSPARNSSNTIPIFADQTPSNVQRGRRDRDPSQPKSMSRARPFLAPQISAVRILFHFANGPKQPAPGSNVLQGLNSLSRPLFNGTKARV